MNIDAMLRTSGVSKNEINMIAVSAGPGSFTGIRIGVATALGLKNGLGIEMSSVSALTAMAAATEMQGALVIAVPTGRYAICIQEFTSNGDLSPVSDPRTITEEVFTETLRAAKDVHFAVHGSLCSFVDTSTSFTDAGVNIARSIGLYCSARPATVVEPLFISQKFLMTDQPDINSGDVRIRPVDSSHIADLIRIADETNLSAWSAQNYLGEFQMPGWIMLRLESALNVTIGFVVGRFVEGGVVETEQQAEITTSR